MSTFPTKNLIFLQDCKSNLKFLVDSGASILILPHSSSAPSTGPHLMGANGKLVPAWGHRHQTVSFAGHDFEFDFFLAAVATPIIGMDFLAKFELSIIPAKQQVLHAGRTFTKAYTSSFVSPWSPKTAVATLPPQVQKLLEEFPSLLRPSAAPPGRFTAWYITSTQVVPPPCSPALSGWTRKNTASPKRSSSPWK
jgi:hypothetical protein